MKGPSAWTPRISAPFQVLLSSFRRRQASKAARISGKEKVAVEFGLGAVILIFHGWVGGIGHVRDGIFPCEPRLENISSRCRKERVARMHPVSHLRTGVVLPERIDVEMGYLYPRKRITNRKERIVSDVVAVSNKHYVRTEILRREQQFAVRYLSAEGTYAERRKKPRHIAIRELTYPPIVANGSAHEFTSGSHPEIAVAADHQVVNKQYAMRSHEKSPVTAILLPAPDAAAESASRK